MEILQIKAPFLYFRVTESQMWHYYNFNANI